MINIIDYGMGNLLSVSKALEYLNADVQVSDKPEDIKKADKIILPGVGNFGDGMKNLSAGNFIEPIKEAVKHRKPMLGICLGLQVLFEESEEAPGVQGLGLIKGKVRRFPRKKNFKIPHMGWNSISIKNKNNIFKNIHENSFFYFVHSYFADPENKKITSAECNYIIPFTAAVSHNMLFATQFHPEKSQDKGLDALRNFIDL